MSPRSLHLHLALTPGIGGRTVARVAARNALLGIPPGEFLSRSVECWREEYGLTRRAADALDARRDVSSSEEVERRLDALGVRLVTTADAHYPALVEAFDPDPPGALFLYGNLALLEQRTFAVLSSRNSRPAELDRIEALTEDAVLNGEILVSGHDRPEYQRSAIVPLRWGAPRILCFDRGLQTALGPELSEEPFRAARLWRHRWDPTCDLAVSPFRPDAGFIAVNNQVRDRLVAAFSRRLDFVTLAPKGGMERIFRLAVKAGRPVRVSDLIPEWRDHLAAGATTLPPLPR